MIAGGKFQWVNSLGG